jgi:hypothetical protein
MLREMMSTQRLVRVLAFKLTGTGTAAIGEGKFDGTLVDNGTGDYTITFTKAFARAPVVVASSKTAAVIIELTTVSATVINIKSFAVDGTTAKDAVLEIIAMGFDSADAT